MIKLQEIQNLIGESVIYKNQVYKICSVHVDLNKNGIKEVRLHLEGLDGYIKLSEARFFEIVIKEF